VIRNFEIIGEATKRISSDLKKSHPEIPWKRMAGLRDKLIYDYVKIQLQLIWDVVTDILPQQAGEVRKIIFELRDL
jgi:uncharacterized protein with HEPN domain